MRAGHVPSVVFRRQFLLLLTLAIMGIGCRQTNESTFNDLFRPYAGDATPGAALMVIRNGQPALVRAYGMANLEKDIPVTSQTNFRLASVTKQFTAMSIMILAQRNMLSIDDTLGAIFPSMPAYADHVTVRHLLQHTSGLIDYESLIPDSATVQVLDRDVLAMMESVDSTYFEPGTEYRYSNTGYAVLAMIVETISKQSFPGFLRDNVFLPLGMENTVAFVEGVNSVPHRAYGYTVDGSEVFESDQSLTSAVLGDGGIYSSVDDLLLWDRALYEDTLVPQAVIEQMFTPHLSSYGFGWRIDEVRGHRRVHHTGSTSGFRNVIQRFPDDKLTVIVLTNRNDPDVAPLADQVADLYLD